VKDSKNHFLMIDGVKMRSKKSARTSKRKNDKAIASDSILSSILIQFIRNQINDLSSAQASQLTITLCRNPQIKMYCRPDSQDHHMDIMTLPLLVSFHASWQASPR
jgi:hypothetical protein